MAGKMVEYADLKICGSIAQMYSVSQQAFTSAKLASSKLFSSTAVVSFL